MKKLLLAAACAAMINPLCSTNAVAAEPTTGDVKHPFISSGGWAGLCDRTNNDWGIIVNEYGEQVTYACLSKSYQARNPNVRFIAAD